MFPRISIAVLFGTLAISGCERSPAEESALKHAAEQSRVNAETYKQNSLTRTENAAADVAPKKQDGK
jgi:hypothetical protein